MTERAEERPRRRRGKKTNDKKDDNNKNHHKGKPDHNNKSDGGSTAPLSFFPHKSPLLVLDEDAEFWYEVGHQNADRNATIYDRSTEEQEKATVPPPSPALVSRYRTLADEILRHEVLSFGSNNGGSADDQWIESTMKRGTLKDRVAAMSVTLSRSPMHQLKVLDQLLGMLGDSETVSASQRQRLHQLSTEALADLFVETYLPPDRRLLKMSARPLSLYESGTLSLSPRVLVLWRFEELVKERYATFLTLLDKWLNNGSNNSTGGTENDASSAKNLSLKTAAFLLSGRPEGEQELLRTLCNKVGDPNNKVAAAAGHGLRSVLTKHPAMSAVVAREIMQLAHRPRLSDRALYNCVVFLNQLRLDRDTRTLASELVRTYFRLFEVAVKQQQQQQEPDKNSNKKKNKETHKSSSRLLSALLTGVNRAHPYLPSSESLQEKERVDALYRIAHLTSSPNTATQALTLLYHLCVNDTTITDDTVNSTLNKERTDRFYRTLYATLGQNSMSNGRNRTLYFNLLYKSMKNDTSPTRVLAFAKRLTHTVLHTVENPCGVQAAALYLLSEVGRSHPEVRRNCCYSGGGVGQPPRQEFDPAKRDPKNAFGEEQVADDADTSGKTLWEVVLLAQHVHPSVSKFATTMVAAGDTIEYGGDPLKDFSLMPFLDRFAYRHPKARAQASTKEKESNEEDGEEKTTAPYAVGRKRQGIRGLQLPVNDEGFWKQTQQGRGLFKVGAENKFFQKFFVERAKRDEVKGIVRGSGAVDKDEAEDDLIASAEDRENESALQALNENAWDSDPEEEEFANTLAEKMMEDAGNGTAHFDEEDPDTEDWGDLYADDKDKEEEDQVDFSEMDGLDGDDDDDDDLDDQFSDDDSEDGIAPGSGGGDDADAFMDAEESDSDDDGGVIDAPVVKVPLQSKGGVNQDDSEDSDEEEESEMMASFANMEDSDEEEDATNNNTEEVEQQSDKKSAKKPKLSAAFEDAADYQKLIAKAWADRDEVFGTAAAAAEPKKDAKKEKKASSNKASPNTSSVTPLARESGGKKKRRKRKIKS